ncbi:hypothetical protein [Marinobacterium jannaschii]|uniref:hypothetical protein n=1 Tax=Marinobacterium jannaschii TaxID=64970 RepID=UPI000487051E|nr:hypothetical protein [Marinobacterium jannaschii]
MALISPKKDVAVAAKRSTSRTTQINVRLLDDLEKRMVYHDSDRRSEWIVEAIVDFLSSASYLDADWSSANDEDADLFISALLPFQQLPGMKKDATNTPLRIAAEPKTLLDDAVSNVAVYRPALKKVRLLIIHAAISRRCHARGKLFNEVFTSFTADPQEPDHG